MATCSFRLGDSLTFRVQQIRLARLLTLLTIMGCLFAAPAGWQSAASAQAPIPEPPSPLPPLPPLPDPIDGDLFDPEIIDFTAVEYPGVNHWLISGRLVGCPDCSGISVMIGGALTASAITDHTGYFEVLVIYDGFRDVITANAVVLGVPIPQAISEIGL